MTAQITVTGGVTDDEEAAAAIAAVVAVLEAEAAAAPGDPAQPRRWHDSARLVVQGFLPARLPATPTWGRIERLRRAGRGGSGIVGQ